MKSCPKCNRTFPDEGQKFCTFDGGLLIAPQNFDPNATIRATSIDLTAASERPTSRELPDPNATLIETYPATVALPRNAGSTGAPNTADISPQAPPSPPPPQPPPTYAPPVPEVLAPQPPPSARLTAPSAPLPAPKKKAKIPWIIAGVLLALLLGGGTLAAAFFLVIKPRLDEMSANRSVNDNRPGLETNSNSTETKSPEPSPEPTDSYVPPPDTVEFANSSENLDGKLAEHYFDFSFYYPKSWQLDPKAGVAGASNFVKVERSLPPDFTQENFAVGWYTSTGTFIGDLPTYPRLVQELSATWAKVYPEYRKVSEGPTKINSMQGYEFRWEGYSKGTEKGDLKLWGRAVFLPTGREGDTTGATLTMLSTSLAPELSALEDLGQKGEAPVILESFRFGRRGETR